MKKIYTIFSTLILLTLFVSCSYPDSYLYDLASATAPKEQIMDAVDQDNFYEMINFRGPDGYDTLYYVLKNYKDSELIEFIVRNGANVNIEYPKFLYTYMENEVSYSYSTPLFWAIMNNDTQAVQLLLSKGAQENKTFRMYFENSGMCMDYISLYQLALISGNQEIVDLIKNEKSFEDSDCVFFNSEIPPHIVSSEELILMLGELGN